MQNCAQCGKQTGYFNSKSDFSGNYFCSDECKTKFHKKKKEMKVKGMIKETKCKCNRCGKVWHYLETEEKNIKSQQCWSAYGMMTCCLPIQLYSKQQSGKWEQ